MTVKQASNLICPFMSTAHPDIAEWIRCETTNCMAWQSTKSTTPVEPSHYTCNCGYQKSMYKAQSQCPHCNGYTTDPVYPEGSNTKPLQPDECEGYCMRLPH